ncbi:MAG TPA: rhamnulokinase [Ruminiclostridium sp.]|jgi:rhamnulokinase|nr:rhamnulokinase [Clostridiaceae bacterium]HAA24877.1 rhamnulokinase [Ruminiclostridium sp.]
MKHVLAFDYGAGSGRGVIGSFDGSKLSLKEVHRFSNDPVQIGKSLHWDVLRLYHEMKQGILKANFETNGNISGIGIDTWGVDFGLLDSNDVLLGNPFHYRDSGTEGMIDEVLKIVSRSEIYNDTGISFQIFNTLYQLFSMVKNKCSYLEKAETMLFMPDLFTFFLTGEKACEFTIASTSQMLLAGRGTWAYDLLNKLGIPVQILPDIVDTCTHAGYLQSRVRDELGVPEIPVISVASHDTASAIISVPFENSDDAYLSSGTWSLLGVECEKPIINDITMSLNYTNEGGINRTVNLLKNIMGLWIYEECRRAWKKEGLTLSYDEMDSMAEAAKPFQAFIDVDDDSFYSPGNMPEKVISYCKRTAQKAPEDIGGIIRVVMESLAMKYKSSVDGLEKITGKSIPVLHIVGGGCKNRILNRYTANVLNRKVTAGPTEATAIGNVLAQLIALKEISDVNQAREVVKRSFPTEEYLPEDTGVWEDAYDRYLQIIENPVG